MRINKWARSPTLFCTLRTAVLILALLKDRKMLWLILLILSQSTVCSLCLIDIFNYRLRRDSGHVCRLFIRATVYTRITSMIMDLCIGAVRVNEHHIGPIFNTSISIDSSLIQPLTSDGLWFCSSWSLTCSASATCPTPFCSAPPKKKKKKVKCSFICLINEQHKDVICIFIIIWNSTAVCYWNTAIVFSVSSLTSTTDLIKAHQEIWIWK